MTDVADLLRAHPLAPLAWTAAHEAAAFLRDERPDDLAIDVKSSPTDMVSAMDRGAEAILVERVLGARPDDGFLGEEGGERAGTSGVRWVVDPLDGTVNYLHRLPGWAVSVAVEETGADGQRRTVVGVIVAPQLGEAYVAVAGHGAWVVDGDAFADAASETSAVRATRIGVSGCTDLRTALVSTGFGYDAAMRVRQATALTGLIGEVADIRRGGAATVDLAWTSRGRLDGYFERGLNAWDVAAGLLVATEAGATVRIVDGDDAVTGLPLVCTPAIADGMTALLRAVGA